MHALALLALALAGSVSAGAPSSSWPEAALEAGRLSAAARAALAPRQVVVDLAAVEDRGRSIGPLLDVGGGAVRLGFALDFARGRAVLLLSPVDGRTPAALEADGILWGGGTASVLGRRVVVRVHRRLPPRRSSLTVALEGKAAALARVGYEDAERLFELACARARVGSGSYLVLHGRNFAGGAPYTLVYRETPQALEKVGEVSSRRIEFEPGLDWSLSADGRALTLTLR